MADEKGLLWNAFDAAERALAPRLEAAVGSGAFAVALSVLTQVDAALRNELEVRSQQLWHSVNLPAGSDMARLRRQVAQLDRELRRVSETLERAVADQCSSQEEDNGDDPRASGRERPARAR